MRDPLHHAISAFDTKVHGGTSAQRTRNNRLAARFLASLLASIAGFRLVNRQSQPRPAIVTTSTSGDTASSVEASIIRGNDGPEGRTSSRKSKIPPGTPALPAVALVQKQPSIVMGVPLAGKTIDLTLFSFVRAVDVLAQQWTTSRPPKNRFLRFMANNSSSILFAASSSTIMHAFFYAPSHLPYTYVRWINRIAECDERLINALRQLFYGNFVYGKDTGVGPLLESMAKDYGMPEEWGNPAKTIPIPCELVHHGCGPSCEGHALWRFWRAWRMALGVYGPLQALVLFKLLRDGNFNRLTALAKVCSDAAKSSAFLGAFVALFYYGVCLSRTRLGPKLFSSKTVSPQMWDGGLCVMGGGLLCGWSVLLESSRRQAELMLFVLPRALGVYFPRRYLLEVRLLVFYNETMLTSSRTGGKKKRSSP